MRVALTGGIACGKSLVGKFLNELGVATIDADDIVHEIIPDPDERKRIAAEVFADPEKRKALEARIHPLVRKRIDDYLEEGQRSKVKGQTEEDSIVQPSTFNLQPSTFNLQPSVAIIPLLFESRWDADYDIICCVASGRELQLSRMMTTRGYTREEAEARLAAQLPVAEKAAKSHYVIENDGSEDELKVKVAEFVEWLKEKAGHRSTPTPNHNT